MKKTCAKKTDGNAPNVDKKSDCPENKPVPKPEEQPLPSKDDAGLSKAEEQLFQQYEAIIRSGLASFVEVGRSLKNIDDEKLYRKKSDTFQNYCMTTWDMSDKYAYRLINAAECYEHLKTKLPEGSILPKNESQLRPLQRLERESWVKAWTTVTTDNNGKNLTAEAVEKVVQGLIERPTESKPQIQKKTSDIKKTVTKTVTQIADVAEEALKNKEASADDLRKTLTEIRDQLMALSESVIS